MTRISTRAIIRAIRLLPVLVLCLSWASTSVRADAAAVSVISTNLSHRVVVLDRIEQRLKLMIGFKSVGTLPSGPEGTRVSGVLRHGNSQIAVANVPRLDSSSGNLVFYMPYRISPGAYEITIELTDIVSGKVIGTTRHSIQNIELVNAREGGKGYNWMQSLDIPLRNPPAERLGAVATSSDRARGFILWHRNPFRYVYPDSAPAPSDVTAGISVRMAQDEYEPATFSLYALRDLGDVTISVSALTGDDGVALGAPEVYAVKTVARMKSAAGDAYEMRPRLLKKEASTRVAVNQSQRFWLTFHAPASARASQYRGTIAIATSSGTTMVPLTVEVLPFRLVPRPDKQYGFDMTYEFQEMVASDLSDAERQQVYDNGVEYYRSYREHGLTAVIAHSPFAFQRLPNGEPDLRDLQAALKAFKLVGFTGPFIYYCGHLVQSAKPGWAGSTRGHDSKRHPMLMKEIVSYSRAQFDEMNGVDVYWMPGDEVQDFAGGVDRMRIAERLLNALWSMREKTAIAVWAKVPWPVDITLGDPAPAHGEHWQYPNSETTIPAAVDDAEGMRRAFGLAHVHSTYVGIAPWTFQTSENASGDPMTDLDTQKGSPEIMIAYPGVGGPGLTPEYEAMREGIDDGRYAYQLELRIAQARTSDDSALRSLGRRLDAAYRAMLRDSHRASLAGMDRSRATMVNWILQLDGGSVTKTPRRAVP